MPAPKDIDFYENPFGYELRRLRDQAGLTQAQLSERLGYTKEHISRVETGAEVPGEDFVRDCDTFFNTHGALKALAMLARHTAGLPKWMREWVEAEQKARTLRKWQPLIVDGLLQTEEYARELLKMHPGMMEEQIEKRVTARMERQRILCREEPPQLRVVLHENVLHYQVGSPKVMQYQLQALLEATQRPHITIQVIPTSAAVHSGMNGAFALASINGESDVVYLENARAGQVVDRQEDVQEIADIWEAIRTKALPDDASLSLIEKVAEQWT